MATSDNQALLLEVNADISKALKILNQLPDAVDGVNAKTVRKAKGLASDLENAMGDAGKRGGHALAKQLTGETGKAIALNRMQMMELAHVGRSVFDGLAAGQSPMRILTMESARVAQALGSGEGGVLGGIKALGGAAVEFAPLIAVIAALGVGVGAVAVAFHSAAEEADALRSATVTLDMMGNSAHYSAKGVAEVSEGIRATGVSAKDANAELRIFIENNIAPERLEQFATAAREVAKVLGESVPKAAEDLTKAFTGSYDQMMSVKEVSNALTDQEKNHIKTLYDLGRASDARSEAFQMFTDHVGKAYNDSLTEMDRLHNAAAGSWAALTSAMGNTSAIQGATSVINGLLISMTNWLRQYEAIKALSDTDMKAEQARLSAKLNDPNAAQNYDTAASIQNIKNKVLQSITGAHVTPVSGEMLRLQDQQRLTDIANQRLAAQAITGDTTFAPVAEKTTGGTSRTASAKPTSGFVTNDFAGDFQAGKFFTNPNQTPGYDLPAWELKTGKMANDGVKAIDQLKTKLPELIDPMEAVRQELAGIGHDVGQAFGNAIAYGDNLGQSLGNIFRQIAADYVSSGIENIFDSLMGITSSGAKSSAGGLMSFLGSVFNIPAHANGTPFAPGGLSLVGEQGPELVNLPRGSVVHNATATRSMLANIGGGTARPSEMAVRVYVDDNGNLQAAIERGARRVATPMAQQAATAGALGGSAMAQQSLASSARRQLR